FDGRTRPLHGQHFHRTAVALDQVRRSPSESLRRWLRGAVGHRFLDELLQFSAPAPGDEQPNADGGVAHQHRQNRGGGEGCGYAASLGQRKRVAHIPTAEAEAARSSLIFERQGQARLHLKSNPPWSHQWGPVQFQCPRRARTGRVISSSPSSRARSPCTLRHPLPSGSPSDRSTRKPATAFASNWSTKGQASSSKPQTRDAATRSIKAFICASKTKSSTRSRSKAHTRSRSIT